MEREDIFKMLQRIRDEINRVIIGKEEVVDKLLTALLASGHVLLEDVPGTGKTMLAKTLAKSLDSTFKRVQFTPDLLPSDLSGIHYYNQKAGEFEFRPGPIFTNILLADEINRATPRTQSSLLESMEEHQVTIDGQTMPLKPPFMVIATQNPIESQGTFPLPEAQLDRFFMKIKMGYPTTDESMAILEKYHNQTPFEQVEAAAGLEELIEAQKLCRSVRVNKALYRYIVQIVERTRSHADIHTGVSPRGMLALLRATQAQALLQGRDYAVPDDVKAHVHAVLAHRLVLNRFSGSGDKAESVIDQVLMSVEVPADKFALEKS